MISCLIVTCSLVNTASAAKRKVLVKIDPYQWVTVICKMDKNPWILTPQKDGSRVQIRHIRKLVKELSPTQAVYVLQGPCWLFKNSPLRWQKLNRTGDDWFFENGKSAKLTRAAKKELTKLYPQAPEQEMMTVEEAEEGEEPAELIEAEIVATEAIEDDVKRPATEEDISMELREPDDEGQEE
jgi:hypothetical protein